MNVLIPVLVLAAMGLIFGALLGVAAKVFKVEKDDRIEQITELLTGANCGGCGYAGCSAFAEAVVAGKADAGGCPGTKDENKAKIAEIMGVKIKSGPKKVARVLCRGTCEAAGTNCSYQGIADCVAANRYGGGEKTCQYSCCGLGSCVSVCRFDAISIVDGIAVIDEEKCTACGACAKICPRHVITIMPKEQKTYVACMSKEKGAALKDICKAGCIGCKLCEKACEFSAISVNDNLAVIDYEKCTDCGACAEKCPKKIIMH